MTFPEEPEELEPESGSAAGSLDDLPEDWRTWSPEVKKLFLDKLRGRYLSLGLGGPRQWRSLARPKQLSPSDPLHFTSDENGFSCGCSEGPDEAWNIWMFMAGRGCVSGGTQVYLPLEDRHERIDVLAHQGKPVTVLSLTGNGARPALTDGAPFLMGMSRLFEVQTDDGNSITVNSEHRFLTPQGWQRLADVRAGQLLAGGAPVPPAAASACPSRWREDAERLTKTPGDFQDGYLTYPRSGDLLPRWTVGDVRGTSLLPADADGHTRLNLRTDDQGSGRGYSRLRQQRTRLARSGYALNVPSLPGGGGLALAGEPELSPRCNRGLKPSPGRSCPVHGVNGAGPNRWAGDAELTWPDVAPLSSASRAVQLQRLGAHARLTGRTRPAHGRVLSETHLRYNGEQAPEPVHPEPCGNLLTACKDAITWTRVRAIVPAGIGLFYDLEVPGAANYAANGMFHHNCGKTWAGANWVIEQAIKQPGTMWAVVAPTFRDVRVTCFEGPSGIRRQLEPGEEAQWRRNELRLDLVNGSVIYGYSADQPERLRGSNLSGCWADEMGSWQYEETWYEGLVPALRIGEHPRVMITTTPRPTKLIRDLYSRRDGTVHITTASTWENAKNLSAAALDELRRRYEGTRLGRQELEGELLEDLEGALWKRSDIDAARVKLADVPDLIRVVVGIDPAVTSNEDSDETGIIVAGDDGHGHGYVLADYSMKGTPEQCMREAVRAYKRHGADCIVAEVNNGGDFIGAVVRAVDANVPYHTVRASRGKALRAEPVSALAEQRRLHHVGSFPDLEDQLCSYVPGIGSSPDRMDALVWAVFELRGLSQASWLSAYGVMRCANCEHAYSSGLKMCPRCRADNPLEAERAAQAADPETEKEPSPGSWASVYKIKTCSKGHGYSDRGQGCPRCRQNGLGYLQSQGKKVDTRNLTG